jgi:hypothetical protein
VKAKIALAATNGQLEERECRLTGKLLEDSYWPIVAICQSGQFQRNEAKPVSLAGMGSQYF